MIGVLKRSTGERNKMKIIFLDIDGVMNSHRFDMERDDLDRITDPTRFELLRQIIDETGAEVVLTSSHRHGWSYHESACFGSGKKIFREFAEAGIRIYDKTPSLFTDRVLEIKEWLSDNPDAEEFVIIDDIQFGWQDFEDKVVKTNFRIGRGLEKKHVLAAIEILNANE